MVTATPHLAALLLALLQLGTPASDRVEKGNATECLERSETEEELESLRAGWLEQLRASESVEDELLEIIGSYEMAEFLVVVVQELDRTGADATKPVQTSDFAYEFMGRVPRAYRKNVAGLLGSLTDIEDSLTTLRATPMGEQLSGAPPSDDERFSNPEEAYEVLNEVCFGVGQPAHVQRRLRSLLMFSVATVLAGSVGQAPESFSHETLGDFFETWERLAAEAADSFRLLGYLMPGEKSGIPEDAASDIKDIIVSYDRNGMLLEALKQDAEAEDAPYDQPRMGPLGEEKA